MITAAWVALALLQLQIRPGDVSKIVDVVLDAAIPVTAHVDGSMGAPAKVIGQHKLIFDANRTQRAFQKLLPEVQRRDVRNKRRHVQLDYSSAVVCIQNFVNGKKAGAHCSVLDDGIYFAITTIETGSKTGEYRVTALVEWTSGKTGTSGTETKMFVEQINGTWTVTKKGTVRAYQS